MGAWTNEGLYWLAPRRIKPTEKNPQGRIKFEVNSLKNPRSMSHEEYANKYFKKTLEDTLQEGFIRVQAIAPQYLFIQHEIPQVRGEQETALWNFFTDGKNIVPYNDIVVQRPGKHIDWKKGQELNAAKDYIHAFEFTKTGQMPSPEEMSHGSGNTQQPTFIVGGKPAWLTTKDRERDIAQLHPYYQKLASPLGDWTLSFAEWFQCNQNTGST